MPKTIFFVLLIEIFLIIMTTVLLAQPNLLLKPSSGGAHRKTSLWGGIFCLCITFLWSIVLGLVMSAGDLAFRF